MSVTAGREPDPRPARHRDHRRSRTPSTRDSAVASTSPVDRHARAVRQGNLDPARGRWLDIRRRRQQLRRLHPFRRRDNHRDKASGCLRQLPILATPGENLVRVHVMPARHDRHRNPGLVALRHDPALPRLAPATAAATNPTVAPGTRLFCFVRHPHKCPLNLGGHLRRAPLRARNLPNPRQKR